MPKTNKVENRISNLLLMNPYISIKNKGGYAIKTNRAIGETIRLVVFLTYRYLKKANKENER